MAVLGARRNVIIGIDPGLYGHLSVIDKHTGREIANTAMPLIKIQTKPAVMVYKHKDPKIVIKSGPNKGQRQKVIKTPAKYRTEIDMQALSDFFYQYYPTDVYIEKQSGQRGNSAVSNNTIGKNYGMVYAAALLCNEQASVFEVTPREWKTEAGLTHNKDLSIDRYTELNDDIPTCHDHAEAYLIAYYSHSKRNPMWLAEQK